MNTSSVYFFAFAYLACIILQVQCAPVEDYSKVKILENRSIRHPDGSFEFRYLLDNGVSHFAIGTFKEIKGEEILVVKGSFSYVSPDGEKYAVDYVADENGYQEAGPYVIPVPQLDPKIINTIVG